MLDNDLLNLPVTGLGDRLDVLVDWALLQIPSLLTAIAVLIVGWLIAGWAERGLLSALSRQGRVDETVRPFLASLVRYGVLTVTFVAVLGEFGVETASILAVLATAGLAIGLALQGTLSNVASGIMLLWLRPFGQGDYIENDEISGTVESIGIFTTDMRTANGVYLSVPNSRLWNSTLFNYSRLPRRRIDLEIGIGYDDDIGEARRILLGLAGDDARVLGDPEPQVVVASLGDNAVDLKLRCWTATGDYWPALFDLREKAKICLGDAGIDLPFPQRTIHYVGDDKPAVATAEAARA